MIKIKTGTYLAKTFILSLIFIWTLPNYQSLDVIGSQWFHLSVINLIGLVILFLTKVPKSSKQTLINPPIIFLFGFFIWGIGSYIYAENRAEVLIESSRIFNHFSILIVTYFIIKRFSIPFKFLISVLVISLSIESFMVLFNTLVEQGTLIGLTRGQINKGISGNINITAYSILYKIPFAFYLFSTSKKTYLRALISILLSSSFLIIFLLATRSAIITSFLIVFLSFLFPLFFKKDKTKSIKNSSFLLLFLLSALFFTEFSSLISNKRNSVTDRLSTIEFTDIKDSSITQRLSYYNFSINQFISDPLLGLGIGNWKINSIPFTMENKRTYVVAYHAHNDFLQVLAELGIIGILLYSSFFISSLFILIRAFKTKQISNYQFYSILLFATIYFVDANFNFPYARVIIQNNLILIIAFILSFDTSSKIKLNLKSQNYLLFILFLVSPIIIYSHHRVLNSFIEQNKLYKDFNSNSISIPIEQVLKFESTYPNISITTLPLKALKAGYLTDGNQEQKIMAIELAKKAVKDNPYISYGQALLARLYSSQANIDSSKYYAKQAYYNIPSIELHVATYLPFIKYEKDSTELENMKVALLKSNSKYIWKSYIETLMGLKDSLSKADKELLEVATEKFPDYSYLKNLDQLKEYSYAKLLEAETLSKKAEIFLKEGRFSKAAELYFQASKIVPEEPAYVENQARAYMQDKNYQKSIEFFMKLISDYNSTNGEPEFYIGAMQILIEENEKACKMLINSINKGYYPAKTLYNKACLN